MSEPVEGQDVDRKIRYHGITGGKIIGDVRVPFYLCHDRGLAEAYAENGGVLIFEDLSERPLILDTPEKFVGAWQSSGADDVEGPFHPNRTRVFADWARSRGYDSIVVPDSAFEGELGYVEVAGRVGEPQTIVLVAEAVRLVLEETQEERSC